MLRSTIKINILIFLSLSAASPDTVQAQTKSTAVTPASYQTKLPGLIPFRNKMEWGYADSTGSIRIEPKYEYVGLFQNGLAQVKSEFGYGLINEKGEEVIKPVYHELYFFRGGLIRFLNRDGKYGALNLKGEEVIPATYDHIRNLYLPDQKYDLLIVSDRRALHPDLEKRIGRQLDQERVLGLYGANGKQLLPPEFNSITYKGSGIVEACYDRECKYITLSGKEILPQKFHRIFDYKEGLATYCDTAGCGIIDAKGKIKAARKYQRILHFSEGLAPAQTKDGDWGYINPKAKLVIPATYAQVSEFKNGFAVVRNEKNEYGLINKNGKMMLSLISGRADILPTSTPDHYQIKAGSEVTEVRYDRKAEKFIEVKNSGKSISKSGFKFEQVNGKYGVKDQEGNVVVPFQYHAVKEVKDDLAVVFKETGWGVIDRKNNLILPFDFADIEIISPELFQVKLRPETNGITLFGLINKNGEEVAPLKYTQIGSFINGIAPFRMADKQGLLNMQGEEIIKPIQVPENYSGCGELSQGLLRVCHDHKNKSGYVDRYGRVYFVD